jgi:uncharacterized protein (DUF1330 family)
VRCDVLPPVEGDLGFKRLVVSKFTSVEETRRSYGSPEYVLVLRLR